LERRCREERLRCERRLRDAEQHRIGLGLLLALLVDLLVLFAERRRFDELTGEHPRIATVGDLHLTEHRTHDDLDVLVVDVDALRAVHLLHFLHQVVLQSRGPSDAQHVVRVERAFVELIAWLHHIAIVDGEVHAVRHIVGVLVALRIGDDRDALVLLLVDVHPATTLSERRLRLAGSGKKGSGR